MTLAVENLHAAYGEIEVLHGVNLMVEKGEIVALLGANGAGKSTAIKAIMGLVKPSAGRILLDGRDLSGQAAHLAVRAGIALVPEGRKIFKKMTVEENLLGRRRGAQRRRGARATRRRLCAVSEIRRTPPSVRRHAVGGRAADARDRPCADVASELHPDGRAVARPCAARRRERAPGDRPDPPRDGYRRHPGRAERCGGALRSRPALMC